MRTLLISFLMICILGISTLFADNSVCIDDKSINEYKGRIGKWELVQTKGKLYYFLRKYGATLEEIREINGSDFSYNTYLFVPYSEKYLEKIREEGIARLQMDSTDNDFIWPLKDVDNISCAFGIRFGRLHTGADFPATRGTPIVAVMDGRVISASYNGGWGNTIMIEHRDNFYSRYAHNSVNLVKVGDYIKKGQIIAYVGSSGRSTGNHLHFEIRYNDIPLNPLDFLPINDNLKETHQLRNYK